MTADSDANASLERLGEEWVPSANPWLITVAVMLATFMEVLDTSISTVALPYIAGNLSATTDEATWVLTSYLISNAIVLPASGWLGTFFGRKRFLMVCVVIFTLSSLVSGAASSLGMLVMARIVQGAGGGALQPISQAILLESFPPQKRGVAMAAFGIGVVVAPIIGPTLGGWLTDNYSWRWAYYINLPVGVLALLMMKAFIEDPPYARKARPAKVDAVGFALMALALATLQIIFDKGQELDWFASLWIRWLSAVCGVSALSFILWELHIEEPIVKLRVFLNRNFLVGTALVTLLGVVLYSAITLQPLFLQTLMGYTALLSGWALSPRGAGALLVMPLVGVLSSRVDTRWLVGFGFLLLAYSMYMLADVNLQIGIWDVAWPMFLTGVAIGCVFVPLAAVTMGTLPKKDMGNGAGLFNLLRNIGGSVGISAFATMLARGAQAHQAAMVAQLTPGTLALQSRLQELQQALGVHFGAAEALRKALGTIYGDLLTQSMLWAFVDDFRMLALISLLCIAVVIFFKNAQLKGPVATH
jgi:DHA2 family multidrug resistance protein